MSSPTARTLAYVRKRGGFAEVQETWDHFRKRRRDMLGFIDILALCPPYTIGIQATSGDNVSARVKKIVHERTSQAEYWLRCGNYIEVWGWKKYAQAIDGKWWRPRIVPVTLEDLQRGQSENH